MNISDEMGLEIPLFAAILQGGFLQRNKAEHVDGTGQVILTAGTGGIRHFAD